MVIRSVVNTHPCVNVVKLLFFILDAATKLSRVFVPVKFFQANLMFSIEAGICPSKKPHCTSLKA
jgi:hypothetical protein